MENPITDYDGKIAEIKSTLIDAHALIITLRGVIIEQAQKVEDLEKQAYADKLVRDQLVAALTLARAHLDWSLDGQEFRTIAGKLDKALAAAGVTL